MEKPNKKIQNATPLEYEGIKFKSTLEVNVFKVLEENNLDPKYEPETVTLIDGWKPITPFYERSKKTGQLQLNSTKIISIKYTPDIIFSYGKYKVFVEVKGRENDTFYLKKKLFRRYLELDCKSPAIYAEIRSAREASRFLDILKTEYNEES